MATLGRLIGVGGGYLLAYGMIKLTESTTKLDLVLLAPLRRAVSFKPAKRCAMPEHPR